MDTGPPWVPEVDSDNWSLPQGEDSDNLRTAGGVLKTCTKAIVQQRRLFLANGAGPRLVRAGCKVPKPMYLQSQSHPFQCSRGRSLMYAYASRLSRVQGMENGERRVRDVRNTLNQDIIMRLRSQTAKIVH